MKITLITNYYVANDEPRVSHIQVIIKSTNAEKRDINIRIFQMKKLWAYINFKSWLGH